MPQLSNVVSPSVPGGRTGVGWLTSAEAGVAVRAQNRGGGRGNGDRQ